MKLKKERNTKQGFIKDLANKAGNIFGDSLSVNSHTAVDVTIEGMNLFKQKAGQTANVDFAQSKGNLFEYIESAKFNKQAAMQGEKIRAFTTDSLGDPHAAADILIKKGNNVVREVQENVSETYKGGKNTSAADSVFNQTGGQNGHWGKYKGMQRLIRKDKNYNSKGSLLDESKKIAKARADSKGIHAKDYQDTYENLTDELNYDNVSSGGTTIEELHDAYNNPDKYARKMEHQQLAQDMKLTAVNMEKAGAVTSGVVSGISNMFQVYQNEKDFEEALHDVGVDVVRGGIRGGATGALTSVIRYEASKTGINILTDSTAATIMAGGLIDGGVALYSYAKGEISEEELKKALVDTTAKSVTTVYFTKTVGMVVGSANPFLPMTIYTVASYVVTSTREIIENAKLQAEEYDRIKAMYDESTKLILEYRQKMNAQMLSYEESQRTAMQSFLRTFDYNMKTGDNYDQAIYSIIKFADQTGIALQHTHFDDFKSAMETETEFVLRRR